MTKDFGGKRLDIFREDIVTSLDKGEDTSRADESKSCSSRCPIGEEGRSIHFLFLESSEEMGFLGWRMHSPRPRRLEDTRDIVIDRIIDADMLRDIVPHFDQVDRRGDFFGFFCMRSIGFCFPDELLINGRWIVDQDLHEESIELSLRKRIGPLMFDRILGREDEESFRQFECRITDGDMFLFHSFEERRLDLRWSTIDLISEEYLSKNRSLPELEFPSICSIDLCSREVWGKEVRSEGNTLESITKNPCKCLDRESLPESWNSFDEYMPSGKERDDDTTDKMILTDDRPTDRIFDMEDRLANVSESRIHARDKLWIISEEFLSLRGTKQSRYPENT